MTNFSFDTYISPFTWRYGSQDMRRIFSENHKYEIWRKIWVILAEVQYEAGLVTRKEFKDLKDNEKNIDINRILETEKETKHDLVAAIKEYADKAKIGGGKIHLGATSMDIIDNAEVIRVGEAIRIIESRIHRTLSAFTEKIVKYAKLPCVGYTHLQPAEPTTVGYRLAFYAQDLDNGLKLLKFAQKQFKAKGMKGAVGTRASYTEILAKSKLNADDLDLRVMKKLGLEPVLITSQVYPRQSEYVL